MLPYFYYLQKKLSFLKILNKISWAVSLKAALDQTFPTLNNYFRMVSVIILNDWGATASEGSNNKRLDIDHL